VALAIALGCCLRASGQLTLSSNLVQVGVVVSDSKGPVRGLRAEDFVVLDNGTPRKVRVLLEQSGATAANDTLPAAVHSNEQTQATGTPTFVLMDNLNVIFGVCQGKSLEEDHALARAKPALIAALKEMDIHTPIALYGLGRQFKVLCDFTCSREQLLDAVQRYDPMAQTWCEEDNTGGSHGGAAGVITDDSSGSSVTGASAEEGMIGARTTGGRAQTTISALQAIAARASTIPGRKNLLWLTANLPYSGETIARIMTPAKITIYPVDSRGLQLNPHPVGIDAMRDMAADTGGIAYVNTNDIRGAIRSVIDDRSATYTLGFYVDAASVDGKFHLLKIRAKTHDATLRYARGYFATKGGVSSTQQVALASLLRAAIHSPFEASAVPLAVTMKQEGTTDAPSLRLEATVGLSGVSLQQDESVWRGEIDVFTVEQNAAGDVLAHKLNQMQLGLTNQQFDDYTRSGVKFSVTVHPQPQTSVIRVIVRDPITSRMGSMILPLRKVQ